MRTWQVLEEDAEFVTCIRPDCGYGQLHAGGLEDPVVICGSCGTRTCFIHRNTAWHEGLTCAEYEEMTRSSAARPPRRDILAPGTAPRAPGLRRGWVNTNREEFLSMRMIAEIAKPCPYCNAATERIGGCKQMICGLCRREWCWDCGIRWRRGHLDYDCSSRLPHGTVM
ncbi:hypothetical protein BDV59DRAFT_184055 [Aspergillus ambiguus]|uniref:BRcat and Rcat domain-containing protein n=1 Tax=Aspergillus ambiguus TaxID=176160 RepID=UPI003CCD5EF0